MRPEDAEMHNALGCEKSMIWGGNGRYLELTRYIRRKFRGDDQSRLGRNKKKRVAAGNNACARAGSSAGGNGNEDNLRGGRPNVAKL